MRPTERKEMQSAYSLYGSRIHLVLNDDVADAYNRANDAWLKAQKDHEIRTGSKWNPKNESLLIDWTDAEQKAFNGIARIMNLIIEVNGEGLDIPEEEITSDYLVKL